MYHSHSVQVGAIGEQSIVFVTLLPSQAVAVNVTSPAATNVTLPVYVSILPTFSSEEDHFTDLFVASDGVIAALRVRPTPTQSSLPLLEISIAVTGF